MRVRVPTLKANGEFQLIARSGQKWVTSSFILQVLKKDSDPASGAALRVGYTASRKVGNAVARNRCKRRLREMVRLFFKENEMTGFDLVLIARTSAASYDFKRMNEDFKWALRKLGLLG